MLRQSLMTCFVTQSLDFVRYYSKHLIDQNGRFYQFLRSDMKRTYREIEKDESDKDKKISALQFQKNQLEKEIIKMETEVQELKKVEEATEDYIKRIHNLIEAGVLNEDGEIIQKELYIRINSCSCFFYFILFDFLFIIYFHFIFIYNNLKILFNKLIFINKIKVKILINLLLAD